MRKSAKIAIIVLSVLLAASTTALIAVLIYNKNHNAVGEEALRGNVISGSEKTAVLGAAGVRSGLKFDQKEVPVSLTGSAFYSDIYNKGRILFDETDDKKTVSLELNSLNPEENQPFYVDNMFPGDSYTKHFRLNVSYKDQVEVIFRAIPRPGYEFLSGRLGIRVYLETTGEELYSGRISAISGDITKVLTRPEPGTEELLYRITVSLDTSAGNEYQNQEALIDFQWSVKDEGSLIPPKTGVDSVLTYVLISAVSVGLLVMLLIVWKRRKRQKENEA